MADIFNTHINGRDARLYSDEAWESAHVTLLRGTPLPDGMRERSSNVISALCGLPLNSGVSVVGGRYLLTAPAGLFKTEDFFVRPFSATLTEGTSPRSFDAGSFYIFRNLALVKSVGCIPLAAGTTGQPRLPLPVHPDTDVSTTVPHVYLCLFSARGTYHAQFVVCTSQEPRQAQARLHAPILAPNEEISESDVGFRTNRPFFHMPNWLYLGGSLRFACGSTDLDYSFACKLKSSDELNRLQDLFWLLQTGRTATGSPRQGMPGRSGPGRRTLRRAVNDSALNRPSSRGGRAPQGGLASQERSGYMRGGTHQRDADVLESHEAAATPTALFVSPATDVAGEYPGSDIEHMEDTEEVGLPFFDTPATDVAGEVPESDIEYGDDLQEPRFPPGMTVEDQEFWESYLYGEDAHLSSDSPCGPALEVLAGIDNSLYLNYRGDAGNVAVEDSDCSSDDENEKVCCDVTEVSCH